MLIVLILQTDEELWWQGLGILIQPMWQDEVKIIFW